MTVLPYSQLFVGSLLTIVISGPYIQVIDTSTGHLLYTTADHGTANSSPIRCAAVDKSGRYIATSGEDKLLKIWEVTGLKLLSERELPKRPTAIQFTTDNQTILVSDKFGDIFSYPFHFTSSSLAAKQQKDALSSHENPSGGRLILGHTSLLTAFLLSADEKYIITADRDEHIRVSWYPQGYNIEMYCLGHTKFVSALHNPPFAPSDLVSGGGDPMLKVWDWMTGTIKHEIIVKDSVEQFIVARGMKVRGDDDDDDTPRRKGKGKKSKSKQKMKKDQGTDSNIKDVETMVDNTGVGIMLEMEVAASPTEEPTKAEKVLAIQKITTVASKSAHYIVFSVVGATAMFASPYPGDGLASCIHTFDLGKPIIDFSVSDNGFIWVSLDGNWSPDHSEDSAQSFDFVHVLDLSPGEFMKADLESSLLTSLNTKCLLPATMDEIRDLDLYGDLTAMPKYADAGQEQEGDGPLPNEGSLAEKPLNKKALGRLKNKQAVLEKVQASGGMITDSGKIDYATEGVKERDTKKKKSEHEDLAMPGI